MEYFQKNDRFDYNPRRRRRAMARRLAAAAAAMGAGLLLAGCGSGEPGSPLMDSTALKGTVVLATLDSPVPAGKSAVWCATFGMAWKKLSADVFGRPVRVAGAEGLCERLDREPIGEGDLPAGSWYAAAGWVKDGIGERIRKEMAAAFPAAPAPDLGGAEGADAVAVAYAYLEAAMKFDVPFRQNENPLEFEDSSGKSSRVRSFGLGPLDRVALLHSDGDPRPSEFAIDPCRTSAPVQVILARTPWPGSIAGAVAAVEAKIAGHRGDRDLHHGDVFLVPEVRFDLRHRFRELIDHEQITEALQSVRFRLDRTGVELKSDAKYAVPPATPRHFLFDRPFLVVLKNRGGGRPFFAAWLDDPQLLVKW